MKKIIILSLFLFFLISLNIVHAGTICINTYWGCDECTDPCIPTFDQQDCVEDGISCCYGGFSSDLSHGLCSCDYVYVDSTKEICDHSIQGNLCYYDGEDACDDVVGWTCNFLENCEYNDCCSCESTGCEPHDDWCTISECDPRDCKCQEGSCEDFCDEYDRWACDSNIDPCSNEGFPYCTGGTCFYNCLFYSGETFECGDSQTCYCWDEDIPCDCATESCTDSRGCCTPDTCAGLGYECGDGHDDGCGGTLDCGSCPASEPFCLDGECFVVFQFCSDGTVYGQCSDTQPRYCDFYGSIYDDCNRCGCPGGQVCLAGGSCVDSCPCTGSCACDDFCTLGCNVFQDPDCGCEDGDGCCPSGCHSSVDDDCGDECTVQEDCEHLEKTYCVLDNKYTFPSGFTGFCPFGSDCYLFERLEAWYCNSGFDPDICTPTLGMNPHLINFNPQICNSGSECVEWTCPHNGNEFVCYAPLGNQTGMPGIIWKWDALSKVNLAGEDYCDDHLDHDCDGCVDGADSDCGGTETNCNNLHDDDCDGKEDYADEDCCYLQSSYLNVDCTGGHSEECEEGDEVEFVAVTRGKCDVNYSTFIQTDLSSLDGSCTILNSEGSMDGFTNQSPDYGPNCAPGHSPFGDECVMEFSGEMISGYIERIDSEYPPTNTEEKNLGVSLQVGKYKYVGGDWISPYGTFDRYDRWTNDGSAVDKDLASRAYTTRGGSELYLDTNGEYEFDQIRIVANCLNKWGNYVSVNSTVRIYEGGNRYSSSGIIVFEGDLGGSWTIIDIPGAPRNNITSVSVEFFELRENNAGNTLPGYLWEVQLHNLNNYSESRSFISFDTSSISSIATIKSSSLHFAIKDDKSTSDFNISIESGRNEWMDANSLNWDDCSFEYNKMTLKTNNIVTDSYYAFLLDNRTVNRYGRTQFRLFDDNSETPDQDRYVEIYGADDAIFKPKLIVTYIPNTELTTGKWEIPEIPEVCKDQKIYAYNTSLWRGDPVTSPLIGSIQDANFEDVSPVRGEISFNTPLEDLIDESVSVSFSGILQYKDAEESVANLTDTIVKAEVNHENKIFTGKTMTNDEGYFSVELDVPYYVVEEDFWVTFYITGDVEAFYECLYRVSEGKCY